MAINACEVAFDGDEEGYWTKTAVVVRFQSRQKGEYLVT